jgi:hypothetical protein
MGDIIIFRHPYDFKCHLTPTPRVSDVLQVSFLYAVSVVFLVSIAAGAGYLTKSMKGQNAESLRLDRALLAEILPSGYPLVNIGKTIENGHL